MRRTLLALFAFACGAFAAGFSLEQVMSAPFPSELVAAPGGGKVAWLLNERGARNIWIAAAPDFKGVRATSYKEDDGTDIGQLQWTPEGRAVVYVRGGDLEFLGRADPNPSANTDGTDQAIWIVAPGELPRRISDGHSPVVAPRGDRIVFVKGGMIWTASLSGAPNPAPLYKPRAGVTSAEPVWSPDGSKLAFVSDRVNHSFIAVYEFESKSLSYLDPSVDHDLNPAWSPDGMHVAFIRTLAGGGAGAGRGARSGEPWTIRVASIGGGESRQIWRADPGPGSLFHPMVSDHQLYWTPGGRILFPWEKDGWQHLYSVPVEGGTATLLTPGEFEVEHVALSGDRSEAIFSSNQDDIDRRHIWRVPIAGGRPTAMTTGETIEWTPVPAGAGIAYIQAGARRPAHPVIQLNGTSRDLAPQAIPADFPADALVAPQQVVYSASDGMPIHGQLFLPAGQAGQKHPALVFLHGGSRRQMLLGWHPMEYYNNAYAMNQYLASQGYIVLSINYRSGIGYGLNFREALNFGLNGASEYHDVEGAGLYLRARGDVDPKRIGLWGGSYGGYLTAMGLARGSDLFAAGVDFHGVHDWSARFRTPAAAAVPSDTVHTAFDSSPISAIRTWRSPVLLIHGDDDRNVDFSQTVELVAALRRQNIDFEQLILPDEIHAFLRHASWLKAYAATADFFKRKL